MLWWEYAPLSCLGPCPPVSLAALFVRNMGTAVTHRRHVTNRLACLRWSLEESAPCVHARTHLAKRLIKGFQRRRECAIVETEEERRNG